MPLRHLAAEFPGDSVLENEKIPFERTLKPIVGLLQHFWGHLGMRLLKKARRIAACSTQTLDYFHVSLIPRCLIWPRKLQAASSAHALIRAVYDTYWRTCSVAFLACESRFPDFDLT